jgi:hypothetical protein
VSESIDEARQKLPLQRLMEQYGDAPTQGGWRSFRCPFCQKKSAAVRETGGRSWFKCFHPACPSGTSGARGAWDEVGYLAHKQGVSRRDAFINYLKEAGVWKERDANAPSVMPGQRARRRQPTATMRKEMDEIDPRPAADEADDFLPPEEGDNKASGNNLASQRDGKPVAENLTPPPESEGHPFSAPHDSDSGVNLSPAIPSGASTPAQGPTGDDGGSPAGASSAPSEPVAPPPPGGSPPAAPLPEPEPLRALRRFYEQLKLVPAHAESLTRKRGLTSATIEAMGYRSSVRENLEVLEALSGEFAVEDLVASGLWFRPRSGGPKPSRMYHGWGKIRRLPKAERTETREWEEGWCEPILIPYFDETGLLVALRPHKDMVKGQPARLYMTPGQSRPERGPYFAVLTEGEFKAAALWQTLGGRYSVAALPGTSMAKSESVFEEIKAWLARENVDKCLVGYDNEDKSNPNLPGFKAEKWKRYDTVIWAGYLALELVRLGYETRVVLLPDAWRDEQGKADWDSACAVLGDRAPAEFLNVFKERSIEAKEFARRDLWGMVGRLEEIFDTEAARAIRNGVERRRYVPLLPHGGTDEQKLVVFLRQICAREKEEMPEHWRSRLISLANAIESCLGWYYIRKPRPLKGPIVEEVKIALDAYPPTTDRGRAYREWMAGTPERCGDFRVDVHYVMVKMNGHRDRIVTLTNTQGEVSRMLPLDEESFTAPSKFRPWLASHGNFTWMSGERELQALQRDINHASFNKDVLQVPLRGYHEDSGLWFFEDVAFTPEGHELQPSRGGIYWHGGQGYMMSQRDGENEVFRHKLPRMHPEVREAAIGPFFREVCDKLEDSLGGLEAKLCLGIVLALGAGPEVFKLYSQFPGLWLHGEQGQGKSSVARWLMRLWGYNIEAGIPLNNTTVVNMAITVQQYGNLPVWFEEFQPETESRKQDLIKNLFGREAGGKKNFDDVPRQVRSTAIITGVATSTDGQTRSRYGHVQVSDKRRKGNWFEWMQTESARFYQLGRHALRNRTKFAGAVVASLKEWMDDPGTQGDVRARLVHGVAYAGFKAFSELVESHDADSLALFRQWCQRHCGMAAEQTQQAVNVNVFWRDLMAAIDTHAFEQGESRLTDFFKVVVTPKSYAPGAPEQNTLPLENEHRLGVRGIGWQSVRLYFKPEPVIQLLQAHLRRQNRNITLSRSDLQDQMSRRDYWVSPGTKSGHRARFASGAAFAWAIELDRHELGYNPITDEEYADLIKERSKCVACGYVEEEITLAQLRQDVVQCAHCKGYKWERVWPETDPRRGELYNLVKLLEPKKEDDSD